jgi:predicted PurR-regulated permease PerM
MATETGKEFNNRLRQVLMLILLIVMTVFFLDQLSFLFPGFLGAVTLYILTRRMQDRLVKNKGWNRHLSAVMFLVAFTAIVALPFYLAIQILAPRIRTFIGNKDQLMQKAEIMSQKVKSVTGFDMLTPENGKNMLTKVSNSIPDILSGSALAVGNFAFILFLGYFMIVYKEKMEKAVADFIPLKDKNVHLLGEETNNMVRANAIGIPLISLIQGLVATLGYWIFGVEDFIIWGFLTGLAAFFPLIGTALVWIPLVIFKLSSGESGMGFGLLAYSAVVIGNVDYFARMSILKRIGDVHPIITILGVLLGLKLFGFWGFIFGPLLVSYLILLVQIYVNEFGSMDPEQQKKPGEAEVSVTRDPPKPGDLKK